MIEKQPFLYPQPPGQNKPMNYLQMISPRQCCVTLHLINICCCLFFFAWWHLSIYMIVQVVYSGKELNHPFGISHYRNFIFWTEYMNASVFQLDLTTGDVALLRSERPPLFGLRVYDAQSQQGWLLSLHLLCILRCWTVASEQKVAAHWILCCLSGSGVSNTRPAGQKWPMQPCGMESIHPSSSVRRRAVSVPVFQG